MTYSRKTTRELTLGLAFLLPNILGFAAFTLIPLFFSLGMSFTNWDLRLHNLFNQGTVRFAGLENFQRLFSAPDFWQYFGNTIFLMLGIPFSIAGSLGAALMLSREPAKQRRYKGGIVLGGIGLGIGCGLLVAAGAAGSAFAILIGGLFSFLIVGGSLAGSGFYRTIYYLPNFTAGVATCLLWKKMYDPHSGPVNAALQPILDQITKLAKALPADSAPFLVWDLRILAVLISGTGIWWIRRGWCFDRADYTPHGDPSVRNALLRSFCIAAGVIASWKLSNAAPGLLASAQAGLIAPAWLTDYHWAKPAIMIMGFWASIGSNNMLLYLAALGNVPKELHEAAEMDGAGPAHSFLHVTWPHLAPITFFIVIMSVIGGLQGGFETARTMTQGGPAGATTTLSYFVFNEGFDTGRLGYASAISWTLFAFVFVVTLMNWKFGNKEIE